MAKPIGYTGYYPGEKIPRASSGGRPKPYIPNEYDLNMLADSINDMYFNFGDIPGFVADQLDAGIKFQLSANLYSSHLVAEDLYAYSERELSQERGEISGVSGISLKLDPRDIIKDPSKWASKIPKEFWRELTDWDDIESKKRGNLWASITGVQEETGPMYKMMEALQGKEVFLKAKEDVETRGALNISKLTSGGKDIGKVAAMAIVDFQSDIKTALFRDSNFDKVLSATLGGAVTAIKTGISGGTLTTTGDEPTIVASFVGQTELAHYVGEFVSNKKASTYKLASVVGRLNQETNPLDDKGNPLELTYTINGIKKDIEKSRAHLQLLRGGVASLSDSEKAALGADTVAFYGNVTKGPILGMGEARLEHQVRKFERSLKQLEDAIGGPLPSNWLQRNNLLRQVSAATMDLGSRTFIEHGVERAILREVADTFVGGYKINKTDIKRLENMFPQNSEERSYLRNLRILLPTLERDRFYFGMDDFVQTFYDDKVLATFLWTAKLLPKLKTITPDYFIGVFMNRMNYFGLKISDNNLIDASDNTINPKFFLFKWMNKFIQGKDGQERRMFLNTFEISMTNLGIRTRVSGGSHFSAVVDVYDLVKENTALLEALMKNPEKAADILKDFANKNPDWFKEKFGDINDPDKVEKMEKWAKELAEKWQKFHDWLKENADKIGIDITKADHILELLNALRVYNADKIKNLTIGITTKYRGILQYIGQKISFLQNKVFKSVIGKGIAVAIGWKMATSHAISTAITTAIAALSGGTSTFISGAIEKVIQFVVRIVLDTAEKVVQGIFKGDFKGFYIFMEKSMVNLLKWFAWAMGAIGLMAAICMLPMMVILGAFSSQDNSKIGAIGSGGSGQGGGGVPPIIVDPIFGEECELTLACVAMQALVQNSFERVVDTNLIAASDVLRSLIPQYPNFEVARFINIMMYNAGPPVPNPDGLPGLGIGAFQCIGYSIASDPDLTTSPTWSMLYDGTQPGCRKITAESAGLDDHIVFPLKNGHYHIGVLVAVREDGSAVMYDVNYDGNGSLHQWPIMNLVEFVAGDNTRNPGEELTVLRCP
jgi:hypothetical protein